MAYPRIYTPKKGGMSARDWPLTPEQYAQGRKGYLEACLRLRAKIESWGQQDDLRMAYAVAQDVKELQKAQYNLAFMRKQLKAHYSKIRKAEKEARKAAREAARAAQ